MKQSESGKITYTLRISSCTLWKLREAAFNAKGNENVGEYIAEFIEDSEYDLQASKADVKATKCKDREFKISHFRDSEKTYSEEIPVEITYETAQKLEFGCKSDKELNELLELIIENIIG